MENKWIIIRDEQMQDFLKNRNTNKLCCVYRWIVKDENNNIIEGYVGETSNFGLRIYEYRRNYTRHSLEKYKQSTDVIVYNKINEFIEKGFVVELQVMNGLCSERIKEKKYRLENEREGLLDLIQTTRKVWNKIN